MALGAAVQELEMEHLVESVESGMEEDSSSCAEQPPRSSGGHARLAAVAGVALAVVMLVMAAALVQHGRKVSRTAAWSEGDDLTEEFGFHMPKALKTFEEEMKGLTGTCNSGPQCRGNPEATMRTCDSAGKCQSLPEPFCCQNPHSKLKASLHNGEVTCTCETTSKTLQTFEHKLKSLKERSGNMLNKIKIATGQCLTGETVCASQGPSKTFEGVLHCCPRGYLHIRAVKVGLSTMCGCH